MNKRAYIFYFTVILMGVIVSFFAGKKYGTEDLKTTQTNVTASAEHQTKKVIEGYWLKRKNDKIVIYDQNQTNVIAETDIREKDCTEKDSKLLEQGIYLENMECLFKFLQAHTS